MRHPLPSEDRRVRKTRGLLRDALIALILEKGYEVVTVQDIVARADVGRSTFYAHFKSKEQLLVSGFDEMHELLAHRQQATWDARGAPRDRLFGFCLPLLQHVHENRRLYLATVGRPSGEAIWRKVHRMLTEIVRRDVQTIAGGARTKPRTSMPLDGVVQFLVGALESVITWWLDHAPSRSPEEVDALYRRVATEGIAVIVERASGPTRFSCRKNRAVGDTDQGLRRRHGPDA